MANFQTTETWNQIVSQSLLCYWLHLWSVWMFWPCSVWSPLTLCVLFFFFFLMLLHLPSDCAAVYQPVDIHLQSLDSLLLIWTHTETILSAGSQRTPQLLGLRQRAEARRPPARSGESFTSTPSHIFVLHSNLSDIWLHWLLIIFCL